jgi:hypothetical protein
MRQERRPARKAAPRARARGRLATSSIRTNGPVITTAIEHKGRGDYSLGAVLVGSLLGLVVLLLLLSPARF